MGVACRHVRADSGVVTDEIPCRQEQVEEVEAPGAALQLLVRLAQRAKLLSQASSEVGVGAVEKSLQLGLDRVALREHRRLFQVPGEPLSAAAPVPETPATELVQLRLEPVGIARAQAFAAPQLGDPAGDAGDRLRRPVVRTLRPLRELTELCEARDLLLPTCLAVERFSPPRS